MRRAAMLALVLLALAPAAAVRADVFGPISLVSADPLEQADYAHDPAVSGDGRFVVFDGSVGGVTGVWRREVSSGRLEEVGGGDAELPSFSQDGRFVSFTTNEGEQLAAITDGLPHTHQENGESPNVYVRDMSLAPGEAGAFTIASAPDGSVEPLRYVPPSGAGPGADEAFGSLAAGRSAISADGSEVVFITTAVSNLTRYPVLEAEERERGETPIPRTPALQVAVRDIRTSTTQLVSVRRDPATGTAAIDPETGQPEPVPTVGEGGAEFGALASEGGPPRFRAPPAYEVAQHTGASISADGSTVVWMGEQLSEQVAALPAEPLSNDAEPLWRRIGEGAGARTRKVTGGADPESPACQSSGEQRLPGRPIAGDPCQGPFETQRSENNGQGLAGIWTGEPADDYTPQLSADGYSVAFLATAPLVALAGGAVGHSDLYLADMHPGLTRNQALRPLTEPASANEGALATNAPIIDVAVSPDASASERRGQVGFTTQRTVFILGSPNFVSSRAAQPGMNELYDVDLGNDTLTRVTTGYEGGPSEHPVQHVKAGEEDPYETQFGADDGALSPSFTAGGATLAFSSTASNLAFGDDNTPESLVRGTTDGSDVFLLDRIVFAGDTPEVGISPAPADPAPAVSWRLGVTARSLPDGRVRLYVEVPAAGALRVAANGSIPARTAARKHRRARRTTVVRTLANAGMPAAAGFDTITLLLGTRYRALAARSGGVNATATILFTAAGRPALRARVGILFAAKPAHAARKRTASRRAGAKR